MIESLEYRSSSSPAPSPLPGPSPSPITSPSRTTRASKSSTPMRSIKAPDQDQFKIEPHSLKYIPTSLDGSFQFVWLSCLPEYQKLNYGELLKIASKKIIKVTEAKAKHVEMKTRAQSSSRLWFRMRAGRITASHFKSACHTNLARPSISLTMAICHPKMASVVWQLVGIVNTKK